MKKAPHIIEAIIAFNAVLFAAVYSIAGIAKMIFGFTWSQFHEFMGLAIPMLMAIACVFVIVAIVIYCVYSVFVKE